MKMRKTALATLGLAALLGVVAPPLQAYDAGKNMVFSVSERVRVGNVDLDPGTYVIRVVDHGSDLNLLQMTNLESTTVFTTLQARQRYHPDTRLSPEGSLHFDDVPGAPHLLRTWNVPNRSFGYDIVTSVARPVNMATMVVKGAGPLQASR